MSCKPSFKQKCAIVDKVQPFYKGVYTVNAILCYNQIVAMINAWLGELVILRRRYSGSRVEIKFTEDGWIVCEFNVLSKGNAKSYAKSYAKSHVKRIVKNKPYIIERDFELISMIRKYLINGYVPDDPYEDCTILDVDIWDHKQFPLF